MGNILVSCIKGGKCMPFFEGKQDLYQILCFIIIPIIVCTVFYFLKPKKIWVSPIIIMCFFSNVGNFLPLYIYRYTNKKVSAKS